MNYSEILERILTKRDLELSEAFQVALDIANNEIDDSLKSAILVALRCKGESFTEIAGFAKALRELAVRVGPFPDALDTAGTGGDKASLYNVSTATALLLAAMGFKVVKHGNRSVSGVSGSADLLESLGYKISLSPEEVESALRRSSFAFIFAPLYHPAMKNVMPVRRRLGIRTIFNLVGPLSNPASPGYQVVGVAESWMVEPISKALQRLGVRRAAVIHGFPRIDEVSPIATTTVALIQEDSINETYVDVRDFGVEPIESLEPLKVKSVEESKEKVLNALKGIGPEFNFLLVNAALALHVLENIDVKEAAKSVKEYVESVDVLEKVRKIVEASGGTPTF